MKPLRILLADDHEMLRQGLRRVIAEQPGWSVCAEVTTGRAAVAKTRELNPDLIILDFTMPELNGLEAARQIRIAAPTTRILIYSMHQSEELIRETIAAGAHGYVLKSDAGHTLIAAIHALMDGKTFYPGRFAKFGAPSAAEGSREKPDLTPREREVVQLIAEGKSSKEIADLLTISIKTCETHRTNILRKLSLRSASELVRYAIRNHIVEP